MVNIRDAKITFAEELNERMRENGVTYRQTALAVGVTKGAFIHYKSGNSFPELFTLIRISNYLNCSVDSLLGYRSDGKLCLSTDTTGDFSNEDEFKDYFRSRLIAMMEHAGMNANDLSRKSLVSTKYIEMYLSVHRWIPQVPDLLRICDALDCTPSDLLGY